MFLEFLQGNKKRGRNIHLCGRVSHTIFPVVRNKKAANRGWFAAAYFFFSVLHSHLPAPKKPLKEQLAKCGLVGDGCFVFHHKFLADVGKRSIPPVGSQDF